MEKEISDTEHSNHSFNKQNTFFPKLDQIVAEVNEGEIENDRKEEEASKKRKREKKEKEKVKKVKKSKKKRKKKVKNLDELIFQSTDKDRRDIENTECLYIKLPIYGPDGNAQIRYVTRLHRIQNRVRFSLFHQDRVPLPEIEAKILSNRDKIKVYAQHFNTDPLYYLALNNTQIYGITVQQLLDANRQYINQTNDHSCTLTSPKINQLLNAVKHEITKTFTEKQIPEYDLDCLFPKTNIAVPKNNNNTYHTTKIRQKETRVIPVYLLPFFINIGVFKYQKCNVHSLYTFRDKLRLYKTNHPESDIFKDTFFQFYENLSHITEAVCTTASKLQLENRYLICTYKNMSKKLICLERSFDKVQDSVSQLQKDNIQLKDQVRVLITLFQKKNKS